MHTPCSPGWISWYLGKWAGWELRVCPVSNTGPSLSIPPVFTWWTMEKGSLWNPVIWVASFLPATLSFVCIQNTLPRELILQTLHKAKPTVALWNYGLYFPMVGQGSNLPTHGVVVSRESTKTAEDSFGPLNTLFLICGGTGEFAASHLLQCNSLQNTKQMHSALCRHIITLCVHVTHICSILAVHLVDVWETPRFKVSSVSFVL